MGKRRGMKKGSGCDKAHKGFVKGYFKRGK